MTTDLPVRFPRSVKAVLWSYDTSKLDIDRDKMLIIRQVLNNGTESAVAWARDTYTEQDLAKAIATSSASEWSRKSLNYWSLLLKTHPHRTARFL